MNTLRDTKRYFIGMMIGAVFAVCCIVAFGHLQKEFIKFDCSQTPTMYDPSVVRGVGYDGELIVKAIEAIHESNFRRPHQETCKKRFPTCIIIGVHKCGTRELLNFLHLHPHVVFYEKKSYEMKFFKFNKDYAKGEKWFHNQMPCSYSNQMTIMKNSLYFSAALNTAERIARFNSSIKMILLVREPVARVVSHYMFDLQRGRISSGTSMEQVLFQNNVLNEQHKIIKRSTYVDSMIEYLKYFTLDQILIIDSEEFKYNPVKVLQKVEDFLGVKHYIKSDMFAWNEEKGYYCIKTNLTDNGMACYPPNRGKHIVEINPQTKAILTEYFKPKNKRFYDIIGRTFDWD